jgi:hypothetical protein
MERVVDKCLERRSTGPMSGVFLDRHPWSAVSEHSVEEDSAEHAAIRMTRALHVLLYLSFLLLDFFSPSTWLTEAHIKKGQELWGKGVRMRLLEKKLAYRRQNSSLIKISHFRKSMSGISLVYQRFIAG